jgi:dienelactone hydrolase
MIPKALDSASNSSTHSSFTLSPFLAALITLGSLSGDSIAESPRALPQGQLPKDKRLQPLKDLDGYFPFEVPKTPAGWSTRADRVRRQILVSQGLWPMPAKTPLNAVIHGKVDRGDYTVEKVYFESAPGFYVTGSLYRPKGKSGKLPAVLCPHGHWADGRFHDAGVNAVKKEIVQGAERFEEGGRSPLQARCVQLARMGCVVFHYDMIGYADSQQISFELTHRFGKQRPEMNSEENWGFFSPQAESHLQSIMGLQTLNSIRALDFMLSLPDVDSGRVACTGASGGGTQTMLLSGIDPRVTVSFPAVMVSTAMQGGCTCENASLLRVGTGNIEFAALFAPKPQGMTAANDWTKQMTEKGFPELKQHYKMMGAPDNVMLKSLTHFDHNYNYVSRAAMYSWLNKHFKLGLPEPIIEGDYKRLSKEEMSVWDDNHPKPESGADFERKLVRWLTADARKQLKELESSPDRFRRQVDGGLDVVIGRGLAEAGEVDWDQKEKTDRGEYLEMTGLLRNTTHAEELPVVFLYPKQWNGQTIVWLSEQGKAGLFLDQGDRSQPKGQIKKLLDAGATVLGVDLLYQGEFLADGKPITKTPRVKNTRESAAYTFGYNNSVFAQRVHDILTVVKFWTDSKKARNLSGDEPKATTLDLVGLDGTGALVAAARSQARAAIDRSVIAASGFRFGKLTEIHDPNFLPGGAKYGDLPGLLAAGAPGKLLLMGNDRQAAEITKAHYKSAGAEANLSLLVRAPEDIPSEAIKWLLAKESK